MRGCCTFSWQFDALLLDEIQVSELEREYILQRQKEGIAIAKDQGKYKGRKRIENVNFGAVYTKWQENEITAVQAMKILNMKKSTFYRRVDEKQSTLLVLTS